MASEDSRSSVLREFPGGPGVSPERDSIAVPPLATPVHRPSHLEDETDAFWGQVAIGSDELRDLDEYLEITLLRATARKALEEREYRSFEFFRPGHLEVVDAVSTAPHRANAEDTSQKPWSLCAELRNVERKGDPPWKPAALPSTDGDIEAALTVDESRDVVTEVTGDPIQPVGGTGLSCGLSAPDGLSLLTTQPYGEGVTVNEYRRILGVSSI